MNGASMSVEFAKGRRDNGGGGRDRDGGRGIFSFFGLGFKRGLHRKSFHLLLKVN